MFTQKDGGAGGDTGNSQKFTQAKDLLKARRCRCRCAGVALQAHARGKPLLTLRASAAWMHAFDLVTPTAALKFQSTGASFTVAGLPLARDSAIVEGGVEMHLNPQTKLGLSFSSQFGNNVQDNSVQGNLTWRF